MERQPSPKIVFHNEPKLSVHEVDQKFNARRINLISHIKDFISTHEKFKGKEVKVIFAEKGASSLVSIIETSEEKIILKVHLSIAHSLGEAQFLKVWEQVGVKVPHVIEDGTINGHAYTLMEYIDAKILSEAYRKGEMIKRGIYVELGKILRIMHTPEVEGYGLVIDGKAEYSKFQDWIDGQDIQKRFQYVMEHKLLGEEHGSLDGALSTLVEYVNNKKSSYCHDDFGTSNIFATNPVTIFDPNPRFNNGYFDLGKSMVLAVSGDGGSARSGEQLVKGYFEGKDYDKKALQSFILLNAYMKFPYMHKTKNLERMKSIQEYLVQTKHLLEK